MVISTSGSALSTFGRLADTRLPSSNFRIGGNSTPLGTSRSTICRIQSANARRTCRIAEPGVAVCPPEPPAGRPDGRRRLDGAVA